MISWSVSIQMRHLQLIIEFFSLGIFWIIKEAIPSAVPRYPMEPHRIYWDWMSLRDKALEGRFSFEFLGFGHLSPLTQIVHCHACLRTGEECGQLRHFWACGLRISHILHKSFLLWVEGLNCVFPSNLYVEVLIPHTS